MTSIQLQPCDGCPPLASRQPVSRHGHRDALGEVVRRVLHTRSVWRERARGRNDLARLNERALADIGLTQGDRDFLVSKPFWRE
jgi:uncharacterized protein YjiS (DUF1127 family)